MSIKVPDIAAIAVYKRPNPKKYKEMENGSNNAVLINIQIDAFSLPIRTGNIGTLTFAYSSLIFIARHQKRGGVHMKTNHPTKNPNRSIEPVVVAHPAIDAALPANPPTTMLDEFNLLSHAV